MKKTNASVQSTASVAESDAGKTKLSEAEKEALVQRDFARMGHSEGDKQTIARCVEATRDKIFRELKFVTDHFDTEDMASRVAVKAGFHAELATEKNSHWMQLWKRKTANACRKAINNKRNDISGQMRLKHFRE